jgi:sugar phosphate isomerase/epimerase
VNTLSFGTTNYVAREVRWEKGHGWEGAERAATAHYSPIETFRERFDDLLSDVQGLGFEGIDLWIAHLSGVWATDEHFAIANELLAARNMRVTQVMGAFYSVDDLDGATRVAAAIGATVVGGMVEVGTPELAAFVPTLHERGVRIGIENHMEPTAEEVLARVQAIDDDAVGTTVDVGWYGARGYDPVHALDVLDGQILAVHLKDVPELGAHHSCEWGEGIVPVERCVERLLEKGYDGVLMVDHEPFDHDPSEKCQRMLAQLREWVAT